MRKEPLCKIHKSVEMQILKVEICKIPSSYLSTGGKPENGTKVTYTLTYPHCPQIFFFKKGKKEVKRKNGRFVNYK